MFKRLKFINPLFLLIVILPTALAILYYGLLADDVYVSESRFVVRSPSQAAASPLSAVLSQTGFGGGGTESNDTVSEYMLSRRALEDANHDGFVTQTYADPIVFIFDRFGGLTGTSNEQLYDYFLGKIEVTQGLSSQVMTIRVSAFDPAEAQEINSRLLDQSEALVNNLSERSRADTLAVAREEVDEATSSARDAAIQLAKFRETQGIIDPEQQSLAGLQMLGKLQDELIAARTQLRQLQTYTPRASQIPFLRTQISEVEREIEQTQQSLSGGSGSISSSMVRYQELRVTAEFAEQRMAIALASFQQAQTEAQRKRAYVERIANPSLPDYAESPRRLRSIVAAFVISLLAWGVLSMLMIGVREHRD